MTAQNKGRVPPIDRRGTAPLSCAVIADVALAAVAIVHPETAPAVLAAITTVTGTTVTAIARRR